MKNRLLRADIFVIALAATLRIAWVTTRWLQTGPAFEFDDESLHWQLATHLARGDGLVSDDGRLAARLPVYPLFLANFAAFGPTGILLARLAQALLGAATTWLAMRFARAAGWPKRAAIAAGVLVAIDPFSVFFSNLLLTETLFTLALLALVFLTHRHSLGSAGGWVAFSIALLGPLSVMIRPSAAGLVVLLWLSALLVSPVSRRRWLPLGWLLAAFVIFLPWGLRNRATLGQSAWLGTNGGVTLYDSLGPQADGSSNQSFLQTLPQLRGLNEVELDHALGQMALEQARHDPARIARLAQQKFLRTWSLTPNVATYRGGWAALISTAFMTMVLATAAVGAWRLRTDWRVLALLAIPIAYFTLVHCIYVGSVRYRVPVMPLVEILAAASLMRRDKTPQPVEAQT